MNHFKLLHRSSPDGQRWALFSPCEKYRYLLVIRWREGGRLLNFCMLNPSTADENQNDPTVERCERRARSMGFSGLIVTNIFAYRSTDRSVLYKLSDPIGEHNNESIIYAALQSHQVVCAWGNEGKILNRGRKVIELLRFADQQPLCLRMTKAGQPEHPLYLSYSIHPFPIPEVIEHAKQR